MLSLKRKGREQSAKLHDFLRSALTPIWNIIATKVRFHGRSRLINRWGRKHPQKAVWLYASFAVMILGWNIAGLFLPHDMAKDKDPLGLNEMASAGSVFDGMMTINKNRESIQSNVSDYAKAEIRLYEEMDSLISLKVKTKKDSVRIVSIWNLLNSKIN